MSGLRVQRSTEQQHNLREGNVCVCQDSAVRLHIAYRSKEMNATAISIITAALFAFGHLVCIHAMHVWSSHHRSLAGELALIACCLTSA